ncbi:MAG: DUF167 domain-containing protein [Actinomycetota bacterium]
MDLPSYVVASESGTIVVAFVQPGAARDAIAGVHGAALKIRVKEPPVDGRANRAVERLLASLLDVRPAEVTVVSGVSSRAKRVEIRGRDPAQVARKLEVAAGA